MCDFSISIPCKVGKTFKFIISSQNHRMQGGQMMFSELLISAQYPHEGHNSAVII